MSNPLGEIIDNATDEQREEFTRQVLLELEWLRWFYQNADFGPAHGDVIYILQENFKEQGGEIPEGYEYE